MKVVLESPPGANRGNAPARAEREENSRKDMSRSTVARQNHNHKHTQHSPTRVSSPFTGVSQKTHRGPRRRRRTRRGRHHITRRRRHAHASWKTQPEHAPSQKTACSHLTRELGYSTGEQKVRAEYGADAENMGMGNAVKASAATRRRRRRLVERWRTDREQRR